VCVDPGGNGATMNEGGPARLEGDKISSQFPIVETVDVHRMLEDKDRLGATSRPGYAQSTYHCTY
jgi:hypothetical protein